MHGIGRALPPTIADDQPITALAPMQDVTNLPFMSVLSQFGSPDYFFTEYFRVHVQSRLEKPILKSITENKNGSSYFRSDDRRRHPSSQTDNPRAAGIPSRWNRPEHGLPRSYRIQKAMWRRRCCASPKRSTASSANLETLSPEFSR